MKIKIGDIYQDCAYHPVLCTSSCGDDIEGISLIDGSWPRCCSIRNCAPRKISLKEAMKIKENGPSDEQKEHLKAVQKTGWCDEFKKWWKE